MDRESVMPETFNQVGGGNALRAYAGTRFVR